MDAKNSGNPCKFPVNRPTWRDWIAADWPHSHTILQKQTAQVFHSIVDRFQWVMRLTANCRRWTQRRTGPTSAKV